MITEPLGIELLTMKKLETNIYFKRINFGVKNSSCLHFALNGRKNPADFAKFMWVVSRLMAFKKIKVERKIFLSISRDPRKLRHSFLIQSYLD